MSVSRFYRSFARYGATKVAVSACASWLSTPKQGEKKNSTLTPPKENLLESFA